MDLFLHGLSQVFQMKMLFFVVSGTIVGITVGALPGLTATMGVAILLPVTFYLPPEQGMMILLGVYVGGIYGGSIAAILTAAPELCVQLWDAVQASDHVTALALHAKLLRVWNAIAGDNLPANVKCAIELQGRPAGLRAGRSLWP